MELQQVEGKIKRLQKYDNDYTIAYVKSSVLPDEYITDYGTFVFKGHGKLTENEIFTFLGNWEYNTKRKSWAFNFCSAERKVPDDIESLTSYLQSDVFKGVGPTLAKRIVDAFGIDTLDIIENTPEKLKSIKGITPKKLEKMLISYREMRSYRDLTLLLTPPPISMSSNMIMKIFKVLGKNALSKIEENPYILCEKVDGIGFKIADTIAKSKFNIELNSSFRLKSCIIYILKEYAKTKGHVFVPLMEVYNIFRQLIPEVKIEDFNSTLKLYNNVDFVIEKDANNLNYSPMYLKRYHVMENGIARRAIGLISDCNKIDDIDEILDEIQKELKITYAPKQIEAIKQGNSSNFYIITGGPGTGKSTIINAIVTLQKKHDRRVNILMAAPTGRAAKRMFETTGKKSSTIHRLLEYNTKDGFARNKDNPLDCDVLIVDEFSMVDMPLMYALMNAARKGTLIILVGDIDQLPPVGVGYILRDMIQSEIVPVVKLNTIFRQGKDSLIKVNAHNIREGILDIAVDNEEFIVVEESGVAMLQEQIISKFVDSIHELQNEKDLEYALYNTQILSPMRKGPLGVQHLNNRIQEIINPNVSNQIIFSSKDENGDILESKFRVGDKVMQMSNDYEKDVYNGDLGIILSIDIDGSDSEIEIQFENGDVKVYEKEELKENISLAYATTVHKSQGSEYHTVILLCHSAHKFMNQRNLLYTGVTRAKKRVYLCGEYDAIYSSINTVRSVLRYTRLPLLLKQEYMAQKRREELNESIPDDFDEDILDEDIFD